MKIKLNKKSILLVSYRVFSIEFWRNISTSSNGDVLYINTQTAFIELYYLIFMMGYNTSQNPLVLISLEFVGAFVDEN